jgi:hypothetical protein
MRFLAVAVIIVWGFLVESCALFRGNSDHARYTVTIRYISDDLNSAGLTGQSLLILPVLTASGPDTTRFPSPWELSSMLEEKHGNLQFVFPEAFEKRVRSISRGGMEDIKDFYQALFNEKTTKVQTSDSVWKAAEASYLLSMCVKYAASIKGVSGNISKRLKMEVELWDVAAAEAVWRSEINAIDRRAGDGDREFILGAISKAIEAIPEFSSSNSEKEW